MRRASWIVIVVICLSGCRSALVVAPRDPDVQTVVTVEERPTTSPSDKGLIVRDQR